MIDLQIQSWINSNFYKSSGKIGDGITHTLTGVM